MRTQETLPTMLAVNSDMALADAAAKWAKLGFKIVPIRLGLNNGKKVVEPFWRWQNDPYPSFEKLNWTGANAYGIVLGSTESGSLCYVDADVDAPVKDDPFTALIKTFPDLTASYIEKTPHGFHVFVYLDKTQNFSNINLKDRYGLELHVNGLCLMSPSRYEGGAYEVYSDEEIIRVPDFYGLFKARFVGVKPTSLQKHVKKAGGKIRPCMKEVLEQNHIEHLMRLAIAAEYKGAGYDDESIAELFKNQDDFNLEKTLYQIKTADPSKAASCESIEEWGYCLGPEKCGRINPQRFFDDDGKFVPKLLADELMGEYSFITMKDNEQIYVYSDGFYQPYATSLIKKECKLRLEQAYRSNLVREVVDFIKASTFQDRREEMANLVPLKNGVLDLDTLELKAHSPEHMFFNLLPVEYDSSATCPKILKFLGEISATQEDVNLLLEVVGYCLYRDYVIAKSLMLVGDGSNGKSTFLALAKTFLGTENVSGRSLQDLEEHRFAKADLHHKLANIYSDLPDKALYKTGTFKMLTGRDLITAEKKFMNSFNFVNYAKLLFSCNKVPEAYDDTSAFFRRWIITVFPNQFIGGNCDPYILSKLTSPEELSGLLNLALESLKKLLKNGRFSYSKTTEELKEDYIRKSSPIAAFIMDCIEVDSDAFIEKKALYKVFAAYCRGKSLPIVTETTFFKNLPQYIAVIDLRAAIAKDRFTAFKGIRYSEGVSTVSTVSRVFLILSSRAKEFNKEPWNVIKIPNEPSYTKIGITLDTLDTLDTKQQEPAAVAVATGVTVPIVEVYQTLRNTLNKASFSQHEALDLIVHQRNCSMEEAEKIFQIFVDEGRVFKDSYGLWMWA